MSSRRSLVLAAPVAGLLAVSAMAGSASAATTQSFGCRASVARVSALTGLVTTEPAVANPNGAPCATDAAGLSSATPLSIGSLASLIGGAISVGPANATTTSTATNTALGASALVSVDAVSIPTAAGPISIAGPVQASASYACVNGVVDAGASSTLTALEIGSTRIALASPGQARTIPLSTALGVQIGTVLVNQNTSTPTSNTETLLSVQLTGLATIVVGEAAVTQPASGACASLPTGGTPTNPTSPTSPTNPTNPTGPTSPTSGSGGSDSTTCPEGTTLTPSGTCDLSGSGGSSTGIVVTPAADDIVGGRVISLTTARRLYGRHTACLNGAGPKFVVVGTKAANRITVRRLRMRVLGLGGKDTITVQGGNGTCVNGGAGNDTVVNKQKNRVTVFGANGNDRITLGNGPAYVLGGQGNDRIVAGNGKLNLQGNAGADFIKTGGGADILNGGSGNDVLIAGAGRSHLNGGPGNNRMTAHGRVAYVKAGRGHSVAYVQHADMRYARRHGVAQVHAL